MLSNIESTMDTTMTESSDLPKIGTLLTASDPSELDLLTTAASTSQVSSMLYSTVTSSGMEQAGLPEVSHQEVSHQEVSHQELPTGCSAMYQSVSPENLSTIYEPVSPAQQSPIHVHEQQQQEDAEMSSDDDESEEEEEAPEPIPAPQPARNNSQRLRLRDWLRIQIEERRIPGLEWLDSSSGIFRIPWKHGSMNEWKEDVDALLFKEWALHTGKYKNGTNSTQWKATFRCAMNSLPGITEMREQRVRKGKDPFRVYQFVDHQSRPKKKPQYMAIHKKDNAQVVKNNREKPSTSPPPPPTAQTTTQAPINITQVFVPQVYAVAPPPYEQSAPLQHYIQQRSRVATQEQRQETISYTSFTSTSTTATTHVNTIQAHDQHPTTYLRPDDVDQNIMQTKQASPRYNAMLSGGSMTTTEPLLGSTPISHNIIPLLDSNISPYPSYETPPPSDGGSPIAPRSFSPVSEAGSSDAVYEDLSTISASYTTEHVLTQEKTLDYLNL